MAHVPDYAVARGVKHIVQRHGQIHRTHGRGEVAGVDGKVAYERASQLLAHLRKILRSEPAQFFRRVDHGGGAIMFGGWHCVYIFCT